ncbi:hypothetical protein [Micrococcus lylae]|uniref:Uncharacterized protein n=1 Tax=Micrococcus lylae TaxID=1273 RepID=A0ABY2K5R5_9MICC|nr:hypothetical protein [Micrococcus lylae]TFI01618.1 hypothetical protein E4A49_00965 [Micrococcus lylae]
MQATAKTTILKSMIHTAYDAGMVRALRAAMDATYEEAREDGDSPEEARETALAAHADTLDNNPGLEALLNGFEGETAESLEAAVRSFRPWHVAAAYAVTSAPGVSRLDVCPVGDKYECTWRNVEGEPDVIVTDGHPQLDPAALLAVMGL